MRLLDKDINSDGRSTACLSRHSKLRSSLKDRPNHFMSQKGGMNQDLPFTMNRLNQNSKTGYVRLSNGNDQDDVVSVISQAKSMIMEGKLTSTKQITMPNSEYATLNGT